MKRLLLAALCLLPAAPALAGINLVDKDDWKLELGGFVEMDMIHDTTKSFTEIVGNNPVLRPNGDKGRTQFSIRNSRLAFVLGAPVVDDWKLRATLEMDFLGYEPAPGQVAGAPSEGGFYNSATMRVRHAFFTADKNGWQVLAGQTWAMFGWQPYYFVPTLQVSPLPGELYNRLAQIRVMKTMDVADETILQAAVAGMRPVQRDGLVPSFEGGLRVAYNGRKGAFTGGATGAHVTQPLSLGVTGTFRNLQIPSNPAVSPRDPEGKTAAALTVSTLIPVIASADQKDVSHNLVLGGEFTTGKGFGDQFNGWTGNLKNPLSSNANLPDKNLNLDAGIGGFDAAGNFQLIKLQTFNAYLQYHLPEATHTWLSGGYMQLRSSNMNTISINNGSAVAYNKERAFFANVAHDFGKVRAGFEYAKIKTDYVDGLVASNNRFQLNTWYLF